MSFTSTSAVSVPVKPSNVGRVHVVSRRATECSICQQQSMGQSRVLLCGYTPLMCDCHVSHEWAFPPSRE